MRINIIRHARFLTVMPERVCSAVSIGEIWESQIYLCPTLVRIVEQNGHQKLDLGEIQRKCTEDDAATARGHQVIVDWSPYLRFRSFLKSKYLSIDNKA